MAGTSQLVLKRGAQGMGGGREWVEWDMEEGLRGRGGQAGRRKGVGVGPMIDFLCTILGAVRETGGVRRVERPSC